MEDKNIKTIYSNFKRNNKWLGIIDYKLISIILFYVFIVIKILEMLKFNIQISFTIFCSCLVPVIVFILVVNKEENAIEILIFMFKYIFNRNIYVNIKHSRKFNPKIYKINIVNYKKK